MKRVKLVCTCGACPEQYDVYIDGEEIGYMRLRHGWFYAEYRGETVYEASPNGDGMFESDERDKYLNQACYFILAEHNKDKSQNDNLFEIVDDPYTRRD